MDLNLDLEYLSGQWFLFTFLIFPVLFIVLFIYFGEKIISRDSRKEVREQNRIRKEESRSKKLDVWIGMIIVLVIPVWFIIWGINKLIVNYTDWDLHLFFFTTYMEPVLGG